MPDYHKMYLHLFNEVTRAINILQDAQTTAEEMYISSKESTISLLENLDIDKIIEERATKNGTPAPDPDDGKKTQVN